MTSPTATTEQALTCGYGACPKIPDAKPYRTDGSRYFYCAAHKAKSRRKTAKWRKFGPKMTGRTRTPKTTTAPITAAEIQQLQATAGLGPLERLRQGQVTARESFDSFMLEITHEEALREADRRRRRAEEAEAAAEERARLRRAVLDG